MPGTLKHAQKAETHTEPPNLHHKHHVQLQ
jgi:hypothetical protein